MLKRAFRGVIESQCRLSERFDRLLPVNMVTDGNQDFITRFAKGFQREGMRIVEVGGGRSPLLSVYEKQRLKACVIGIDIDAAELAAAPAGAYDTTICADISKYRGTGDADLVVCQALLEHVADSGRALKAIASMLKVGGIALVFVPSRNAAFARLNLILPEKWKNALLHSIFPATINKQGFRAYYDRCTPAAFRNMALDLNLEVSAFRLYYTSNYFSCFFPVHIMWRMWIALFRSFSAEGAAETFSMALTKH